MAFPGLPETFALIVHHLWTNNFNVFVSKIYPSGLIFGGGGGGGVYTGVLIFAMLIGFHIWSGRMFEGVYIRGRFNKILRYMEKRLDLLHTDSFIQLDHDPTETTEGKTHRSKRKIKNNLTNLEFIIWKVLRHSQTTQIKK